MKTRTEFMAIPIVAVILGVLFLTILVGLVAEPSPGVTVVLLVLNFAGFVVVLVMGSALLLRCVRNIDKTLRSPMTYGP